MPKVRRSRKPPPDGWELIEPTLDELDQKMREGKPLILFVIHTVRTRWKCSINDVIKDCHIYHSLAMINAPFFPFISWDRTARRKAKNRVFMAHI